MTKNTIWVGPKFSRTSLPEKSMDVLSFRNYLLDIFQTDEYLKNVSVLVGEPTNRAFREGPAYITFHNGAIKQEGERGNFCGTDIKIQDVILGQLNFITSKILKENIAKVYLRMGLEILTIPAEFDWFDSFNSNCIYRPSELRVYTRIAFE